MTKTKNKTGNPYNSKTIDMCMKMLAPEMEKVKEFDNERIEKIRRKLSSLVYTLPNKHQSIVQNVIREINAIRTDTRLKYRDSHIITDHAFVRILERAYGFDVKEIKDKALQAITDSNLKPVYSIDGKSIKTVL